MSLGVYQQPSAFTEDAVQSSDKNSESLWNLAARSPLENPKGWWSKWGKIASDSQGKEMLELSLVPRFSILSLKNETSARTKR